MENILETLQKCRITPSSDIQPHEFLYSWNSKPILARGELVAIGGKAKSGKTYICSLFAALAASESLLGLTGRPNSRVLWIDTEQSEDSTQEILCQRIGTLIGQLPDPEQFIVYNLRQQNWQDRLTLVTTAICQHTPDLVIFDGIRDVVGDINDYQQAQDVITKLLSIASWSNASIVCVLHQNKAIEDKTLRGALGTELQNKSFETYECTKDPDTHIFTMRQTATRKYDITSKLTFTISDAGLPQLSQGVVLDNNSTPTDTRPSFNPDYMLNGKLDLPKLFGYILPADKRMTTAQLRQVVMKVANVQSFNFAGTLIEEATQQHIIYPEQQDDITYYTNSPSIF
ncbi:MAG: helicase RepA family protein [Paludibacteraceae bacterium]|nr:helicase RepA family protein [Paludibacteraceae bacterium]